MAEGSCNQTVGIVSGMLCHAPPPLAASRRAHAADLVALATHRRDVNLPLSNAQGFFSDSRRRSATCWPPQKPPSHPVHHQPTHGLPTPTPEKEMSKPSRPSRITTVVTDRTRSWRNTYRRARVLMKTLPGLTLRCAKTQGLLADPFFPGCHLG